MNNLVELNEILDKMPVEDIRGDYNAMGKQSGRVYLYRAVGDYLEAREKREEEEAKKPKGIDVLMTCGEELHLDTDQPTIETVKINGKQIYPQNNQKSDRTMLDMATRKIQLSTSKVAKALTEKSAGTCTVFQVNAGMSGNLSSHYGNNKGVCVYIPMWRIEAITPEDTHKDITELNK